MTYIVTVQITGLVNASGVVLRELLTMPPRAILVVSVTASTGSVTTNSASEHTWFLGDLAVGASATLTVNLRVGSSTAAGAGAVGSIATASNEHRMATTDDSEAWYCRISRI